MEFVNRKIKSKPDTEIIGKNRVPKRAFLKIKP
jgi:hypothetical protein